MIRGEVWWANLPPPNSRDGSAPAKRQPVLVIQCDSFNRSRINTVVCAMITSNVDLASIPGNLPLERSVSGLDKMSVVNFSQLATIDKANLTSQVGMLPKTMLEKVDDCLKLVLDI